MVSHYKDPALGHLIGELYVGLAESVLVHLRFIELLAVDVYVSVLVDIH